MFSDVPEYSGMFRDALCSWFYRRPYHGGENVSKKKELTAVLKWSVALIHPRRSIFQMLVIFLELNFKGL